LSEGIDPQKAEELRSKTYKGEPFGSDAFVRRLEAVLKRSLRPEKRGRPRKDQLNLTDRNLGSHF
jgi:hypothetical protein